jgi:hypothetical protein
LIVEAVMTEDRIELAPEDDYPFRDPSTFNASCVYPENYGEGE